MTNLLPILLAEDDEHDVVFVRHAFKAAEISNPLNVVETGYEAIDYLAGTGAFVDRARHPLPGLVLMEVHIPARTGLEVLRWIRAQPRLRHIVVILWSATISAPTLNQAYQSGVNSFLMKPGRPADLARVAKLIKAYWLECNRLPSEFN